MMLGLLHAVMVVAGLATATLVGPVLAQDRAGQDRVGLDRVTVIDALVAGGDRLIRSYDPAKGAAVADVVSELYFDTFEGSGLEADIGARDRARMTDLEAQFSRLVGLTLRGGSVEEVTRVWQGLRAGLIEERSLGRSGGGSAWTVAVEAFLILIREGVEALLVVAAIAATVRRSGSPERVRAVGHGVGWALIASLVTAFAANRLLTGAEAAAGREALEGVTVLIAAAVLFYVSCWLFAKSAAGRWQAYLQQQVGQALGGGGALTLGLAAFLAVYREGAETVLFYQALAVANPGQEPALIGGLVAATLCLILGYRGLEALSLRLPLGRFFAITAALLFALSVVFVGQGMLELQEARWVSATPVDWLPQVAWLGLFPTVESAGLQAGVLVASLLGTLWLGRHRLFTIRTRSR